MAATEEPAKRTDHVDSRSRAESREEIIRDMVSVIVLSTTAVLTAWCGFESSRWGGEMSVAFSQASRAGVQASNYASKARDARQLDVTLYGSWVEARAKDDLQLADYIQERFTLPFTTSFDAWITDGRQEPTPFERDDYIPFGTSEALEWEAVAQAKFQQGVTNDQRSNNYSLLTVHFALVLFLIAVSKGRISALTSRILLVLGSVVGVIGLIMMLTQPAIL